MKGYLINTKPLTVHQHMAVDEILKDEVYNNKERQIILRFFNWQPKDSVTFGYAQFFKEVLEKVSAKNIPYENIVRRPTGGGIVFHLDDITFSLIFPHENAVEKPQDIYDKLHNKIKLHFRGENFNTQGEVSKENYAPSLKNQAGQCFENPVSNDILDADGKKVLGGAIRRFDNIILYQGSFQTSNARTNKQIKQNIIKGVEDFFGIVLKSKDIEPATLEQAKQLSQTKYETEGWIKKF
ncbi:MAG: hypothetical protein HN833_01400 [Elusimicrobiaceae bacterium]|jgi:lipoate-protein ligase A|nr:hypothetical protein [Elusimicrobiaceae bacterium]MBT3955266.1 hypothetical protein [Elusimicrobiaceae bacterium]MBT4007812.1 hypothetical protein [Elusimicrobiaceae bacterium]MBT4403274.1 hypothetical protein [Elusimicrobiaceae bacterium]MBT4440421.1 hypothetical protein [Elusimicrobiaceae bacterium]